MYRTICTELWTDPKIKALPIEGKCLFVYLITNPHTHLSGIYYCPIAFMSEELKLSEQRINTLLDTLSIPNLAWFDRSTTTVFVVNMFEYQGKGPKNYTCAASHLRTLHHSSLIGKFITRYPDITGYGIDTHSIGGPSTPVPVPSSVSVSVSDSDGEKSAEKRGNDEFESFWAAYPKKVGKKAARDAWKHAKDKPSLADILQAIDKARKSDTWRKDNGQFIPNPSTWLNQGRWDDEPAPVLEAARGLLGGIPSKAMVKITANQEEGVPPPPEVLEQLARLGRMR